MVSLRLQLTTFLTMIVVGIVIGISFDFYRVLRGRINFGWLFTNLGDILFSLLATLVVCGGLLYSNSGRVRIYFLSGVGLGLIIYYFIFSSLVVNIFLAGWKVIDWLYAKANWLVTKSKEMASDIYQQSGDDNHE